MLNEKLMRLDKMEKEFLETDCDREIQEVEQKRNHLNMVVEDFAQDLENIYRNMLEDSFLDPNVEELIEMYRKLQGIIERNNLERSPLLPFSDLLLIQNRLDEAKELNEQLLKHYKEEPSPIFYATVCDHLSRIYMKMNNFSKAEEWAQESLKVFRKLNTKFPEQFETSIANVCFGLATLYLEMNIKEKYDIAESLLKEALEVYGKLSQQGIEVYLEAMGAVYNFLAILYANEEKYAKAEVFFKKNLEVYRELNDKNPGMYTSEILSNCHNLAKLYEEKSGNFDSQDLHEKALQLYKQLNVKE